MNNLNTVNAVANIDKSQLKDDIRAQYIAAGFTDAEYERYMKQQAYRKQYNERADVKAKRAAYSKKRYQRNKILGQLLKEAVGE